MTLYEFNRLDDQAKGEAVFTHGIFIDDRSEDQFKVQLYRLEAYYVEVYYDPVKNEIARYRSFQSASQLAPYVNLKTW